MRFYKSYTDLCSHERVKKTGCSTILRSNTAATHAGNEGSNTSGDIKIPDWSTTNGILLPEKLERVILPDPDHLRTTESLALTGGENTGSRWHVLCASPLEYRYLSRVYLD